MTYRRLLDELNKLINSARRGYRAVRSVRSTVRGRVEAASVLRYTATGDPRLVCRYEELTESTTLLGIICAGLEWIADGHGPRSPFEGRFSESSLRHEAVTLRRTLAEVAALRPTAALRAGPRLRLNRLDRPWARALQLTLAVLAETQYVAGRTGPQLVEPIELSVGTEQLWERIVHQALIRSGFDTVLQPGSQNEGMVVDPWLAPADPPPKTRPDNVAFRGADVWIVDAKYKTNPGDSPDRDDLYQMFAYSHLVQDANRQVHYAMLIYTGEAKTRTWYRGRDASDPRVQLLSLSLPFPTALQVRTNAAWEAYLDESAARLVAAVGDRL